MAKTMAYELTVALPPALSAKENEKALTQVEEAVTEADGKVEKTENLGIKTLSYPVKKLSQASFLRLALTVPSDRVGALARQLAKNAALIRVMLVRKEDNGKIS